MRKAAVSAQGSVFSELQREIAVLRDALAFEKDRPAAELPRLVACAIVLREGMVLLERRAPAGVGGLDNRWDLPGGKVEARETVGQAAEREIIEELGIVVKARALCPEPLPSVWTYLGKGERHWLLVGVICSLTAGEPNVSDRLQWFPVGCPPAGILDADRNLLRQACADFPEPRALSSERCSSAPGDPEAR